MADSTVFMRVVKTAEDLAALLRLVGVERGPVVVKPNWYTAQYGYYTDAATLDLLLQALPRPVVVVEAHTNERNRGGRDINWREDVREHWEWIRQEDRWFLDATGIGEVLAKHGAEYLNVTDEVWAGRAAPTEEVARVVEARFAPVWSTDLYGMVPRRLFELRGATFISFARLKVLSPRGVAAATNPNTPTFSLSMKNVFGIIPVPWRVRWHGRKGADLARSIVDINKIYQALFSVVGVVEAIHYAMVYDPEGEHPTGWGNYDVIEGPGFALASRDPLALDAYTAGLFNPMALRWHVLPLAQEQLGGTLDPPADLPPEFDRIRREARRIMARYTIASPAEAEGSLPASSWTQPDDASRDEVRAREAKA